MSNVILRYVNLPCSVKAYTATDPDDNYNIYINSNLGIIEQEKAKAHELKHILNNHLFDARTAKENEDECI